MTVFNILCWLSFVLGFSLTKTSKAKIIINKTIFTKSLSDSKKFKDRNIFFFIITPSGTTKIKL